MAEHDINETGDQESRRRVLKKIGIAGAAAWVAPTVLSSAAHAQGSGVSSLNTPVTWCPGDTSSPWFDPDNGGNGGGVDVTGSTSVGGLFLQQYVDGSPADCLLLGAGPFAIGFSNNENSQRCYEIRTACFPAGAAVAGPVCNAPLSCPD